MRNKNSEILLRKDKEWSLIDGELCLVDDFAPLVGSFVKNGVVISSQSSLPYASVNLSCKKIPENITGFITHKIDFSNLWAAFLDRGIDKETEEVLIYWTTKHYKYKIAKALSSFLLTISGASNLPKVIVMICPKGTYKSLESFSLIAGKEALVFVYGLLAIKWWIPDVIK